MPFRRKRPGSRDPRRLGWRQQSHVQGAPCLGPLRRYIASSRPMTCVDWSARKSTRSSSPTSARAFARLVRDDGASPGGHRLRHAGEFAVAGRGVRRRRGGPGSRRHPDRAGVHRSAVLRLRSARLPGRDVHRQPQPGRLQRHQAVPRRRQAGRQGHRADHHQRRGDRRRARLRRRRAAPISDRDVLADYGEFLRSLVDSAELRPLRVAVDAGNGMAGHTTPAVLGPIPSITLLPLYFELDGTFPNHEANPLDPANLVDLQATCWRPAPTSGWRSTVTPTAASSSTSGAGRCRRRRSPHWWPRANSAARSAPRSSTT